MDLKWKDGSSLRHLAEDAVNEQVRSGDVGASRERLLHDLSVHEAELRMQNEALRDAQVELQKVHDQYKDLFDHAPVGYVIADTTSRIAASNARAAAVLGLPPEELVGERLSRFLIPDEAIPFEQYRREVTRSSNALAAEFSIVTRGGQRREIRLESVCTDHATGEWRIALTDVSAYNELIRRLDHDERLAAVERHASTVAHDLNNLLYSILGHADVAMHSLSPGEPAYAPVVRLREVVTRCAQATEQLSSFSRAETSQPSIVDLNDVIVSMDGVLRSLLGDGIEFECGLAADDAAVRVDPSHIEQILLSSVKNSRQAMPHGGGYRIETANVELNIPVEARGTASSRFVRWTMSDTGVGMNESTRRRAFEPFFTTKPPGAGTGLGLAMVKAAVERAGGFAALESELDGGTKLVLYLPRATGTSTFPPVLGEIRADVAHSRVMVVKDNADGSTDLADRLRAAGCDVLESGSGSHVLDLLRTQGDTLSVLVVDRTLPEFVVGELLRTAQVVSAQLEVLVAPLSTGDREVANDTGRECKSAIDDLVQRVLATVIRTNSQ